MLGDMLMNVVNTMGIFGCFVNGSFHHREHAAAARKLDKLNAETGHQ